MTSLQDAVVKSTKQTEEFVQAIVDSSSQMKLQHEDKKIIEVYAVYDDCDGYYDRCNGV